VKIGLVCFCGFVDEVRRGAVSSVRIPLVCVRGVPSVGLVWNLGVNDTAVLLVVLYL
jgi:hypothetical protein